MDETSVAHGAKLERDSREMRECRSCYGSGQVVEDVELTTGEWIVQPATCYICKGAGEVSVYLYPKRNT